MAEGKKKSNLRWIVLFGITGTVDAVQFVIGFTGVGIAVSEILEVVTGPVLIGLFVLFKISIFNKPKRIASLLGLALGDAITGGFAPFWVVDVWYIYSDVKKEEAEAEAQQQEEAMLSNSIRQPLYRDGARMPRQQTQTASSGGDTSYKRNIDLGPTNLEGIRRAGTASTFTSNTYSSNQSNTGSFGGGTNVNVGGSFSNSASSSGSNSRSSSTSSSSSK